MILGLLGLGALAAFSVLMSEMPRMLAWPLAIAATAYGIQLSRAEAGLPKRQLVWTQGGLPVMDGRVMTQAQLHWRGPLAFLRWRDPDGSVRRLAWWPDVLPVAERRELRLAALDAVDASAAASMAP